MSRSDVFPSAAFQIKVAVSLRLKSVESMADMIIISPASSRAATALLREMYVVAPAGATVDKLMGAVPVVVIG